MTAISEEAFSRGFPQDTCVTGKMFYTNFLTYADESEQTNCTTFITSLLPTNDENMSDFKFSTLAAKFISSSILTDIPSFKISITLSIRA